MNPFEQAQALQQDIDAYTINSTESLEQFRILYLGSKNILKPLFSLMKDVPNDKKKEFGQVMNQLKTKAEAKYETHSQNFTTTKTNNKKNIDYTIPSFSLKQGTLHPLYIVKNTIENIFARIGFDVQQGQEIEDDWHNFTALNMEEDHPARDMQDTFYISTSPSVLLRTHTSNVQIRTMKKGELPIRSIFPGRVFRNETISARSHCFFHQVEGLYINTDVSFSDLKQTLYFFVNQLFGDVQIRFRPSYFPFTEPSAEMDISCLICKGKGCSVCKQSGWVEILGCGMVDPNVLKNCNIDPDKYTGFAFGMGIERITMLKYEINDLRLFSENDLRFLTQFHD